MDNPHTDKIPAGASAIDMARAIVGAASDMTIATVREDGYPQATTVSYVSDGLLIYFGAGAASQKAKNIARCNKVSATVNLPYGNWNEIRGVSLGGLAECVTDPDELARVGRLMFAKFPQAAKYTPPDAFELAVFRLTPKIVSLLDYTKGFGHTEQIAL